MEKACGPAQHSQVKVGQTLSSVTAAILAVFPMAAPGSPKSPPKNLLRPAHLRSSITNKNSWSAMAQPKFTKLELQIMQALWDHGTLAIREIQEAFPERGRPAYTTIQTTVYRLEGKLALRRIRKIGNAHIFEAVVSRNATQSRLIDDLLGLFGGRTQPVMAHLIETGKLTLKDVKEAEQMLRELPKKEKRH
jgi:BlaI family penicillinase repressor